MHFTDPLNFNGFRLIINGQKLSLPELLVTPEKFIEDLDEKHVIDFIKDWFSPGKSILQQSSGSTGKPKQLKLLKEHMYTSAKATIHTLKLKRGSTSLLSISPEFIGGKMMILRAIINEMNLVVGKITARPLRDIKTNQSLDFFSFVPYQLQESLIYDQDKISLLNNAKAIILGGAPVSLSLHNMIKKHVHAPCYSTYGMTETVSHVALKLLNTATEKKYFEAIDGITFSVSNEDCLMIHAPKITGQNSLDTTDIVELLSPTKFQWLGRKDFVINSAGLKLHPEQLELELSEIFNQHNISNSFFIFGMKDEKWGEKVCLLIEAESEIRHLSKILAEMKSKHRPKEVFYLDQFILTQNSKLNRKASIRAIS